MERRNQRASSGRAPPLPQSQEPQDYNELQGIVEVEIEVEEVIRIKRFRRKQQRYRIWQEGKQELWTEGIICWEKGSKHITSRK